MPEDASNSLNANHERRLSVTCRHIDRLLSDMEGALNASASRLAFPQYVADISPAQRRGIADYITRIRAELVRVWDGQRIERPVADIPVSRSLHAVLEQSGDEVALLSKLESIITGHGLVEFRSTLSMILDRLKDNSFESAIFGRGQLGKVVLAECDPGD